MSSKSLRVIAAIIGIFGVIFGIILGATAEINISEEWYSTKYVFNTGLMFETWIVFDLIVLFFNWCAAILSKLENIEKNICGDNVESSESKNKSIFSSATEKMKTMANINSNSGVGVTGISSMTNSEPLHISNNEWKCPNCGKVNQSYTGTCGCGEEKPK